jgi:hypothetical protein
LAQAASLAHLQTCLAWIFLQEDQNSSDGIAVDICASAKAAQPAKEKAAWLIAAPADIGAPERRDAPFAAQYRLK